MLADLHIIFGITPLYHRILWSCKGRVSLLYASKADVVFAMQCEGGLTVIFGKQRGNVQFMPNSWKGIENIRS